MNRSKAWNTIARSRRICTTQCWSGPHHHLDDAWIYTSMVGHARISSSLSVSLSDFSGDVCSHQGSLKVADTEWSQGLPFEFGWGWEFSRICEWVLLDPWGDTGHSGWYNKETTTMATEFHSGCLILGIYPKLEIIGCQNHWLISAASDLFHLICQRSVGIIALSTMTGRQTLM
jgi:hypothetical protein